MAPQPIDSRPSVSARGPLGLPKVVVGDMPQGANKVHGLAIAVNQTARAFASTIDAARVDHKGRPLKPPKQERQDLVIHFGAEVFAAQKYSEPIKIAPCSLAQLVPPEDDVRVWVCHLPSLNVFATQAYQEKLSEYGGNCMPSSSP